MKKYSAFFVFYFLLISSVLSETPFIDSVEAFQYSRPKEALRLLNDFENNNQITGKTGERLYTVYGNIMWHLGNMDSSIYYYKQAMKYSREMQDEKMVAAFMSDIGWVFSDMYEFDSALYYCLEGVKFAEKTGDNKLWVDTKSYLAHVYERKGAREKAVDIFREILPKVRELGNIDRVSVIYNNMASIFLEESMVDSAFYYLNLARPYYEEAKREDVLSIIYLNLSSCYSQESEFDSALTYIERANTIFKKVHNAYYESITYANKGTLLYQMERYEEALRALVNARNIADSLDNDALKENTYYELAKSYDQQGLKDSAISILKKLIHIRSKLYKEEKSKAEAEFEAKYQNQKKTTEILKLNKEKEVQRMIVISVSVGLSLVILFLIFAVNRFLVTKKQKNIIEEQKEEVETQRDQIELQKNLIEEKHGEIQESINYARRIQTAILPPKNLLEKHLPNSFVLYKPKDVVAGDFYWLEATDEFIFFAVADCTGHGVPGAMVSVVCHGALNRCIREYKLTKPSDILDKTRELVIDTFKKSEEQVKDGMDISLCAIQKGSSKLSFAGANNPLYIVRRSITKANSLEGEDNMEIIKADKEPIGFVQYPTPFTNHELQMEQGDVLYLFSDGYADQFGGSKGKKMGYKKFRTMLLEMSGEKSEEQRIKLEEYFDDWKQNEEQVDDVCIVGVKV